MARQARNWHPGGYFHVLQRGVARRTLFTDDEERLRFLDFLESALGHDNHELLAWCLMGNHVHLAIRQGNVGLGDFIKRSFGRYAQWFNIRHRRVGHLYQERYKSIQIGTDAYLKELVRYIHLNPVKARIVPKPERYRWSSHSAYLGKTGPLSDVLNTTSVLGQYSGSTARARASFAKYVNSGMDKDELIDFDRGNAGSDNALVPDGSLATILTVGEHRVRKAIELDMDKSIQILCSHFSVDPEILGHPGKGQPTATIRNVLALLGRKSGAWSLQSVASRFERDYSSLSKGADRVAQRLETDESLQKVWKQLWD